MLGFLGIAVGNVAAEEVAVELVDLTVSAQDEAGGIQLALGESFADALQHLLQDIGHFEERLGVCFGEAGGQSLGALGDPPEQVADAFEFVAEAQASEEFASFEFVDVGDGGGELLVHLLLDAVEFFFAIADCDKSDLGAAGEEIAGVEGSVTGDQAGAEGELGESGGFAGTGAWDFGAGGFRGRGFSAREFFALDSSLGGVSSLWR